MRTRNLWWVEPDRVVAVVQYKLRWYESWTFAGKSEVPIPEGASEPHVERITCRALTEAAVEASKTIDRATQVRRWKRAADRAGSRWAG